MKTNIENLLLAQKDDFLRFAMKLTNNHTDDARDLMQESLLRMIKSCDSYIPGTNFKAWGFTIVRNTFINMQRRREVERRYAECCNNACETYAELDNLIDNNSLYSLLDYLAPEVAAPLKMFADGYKYCEIAERLNLPLSIVRNRIHAARMKLKGLMDE